MQLFLKENKTKTISNAKEFLKTFPKLRLKAGFSVSEVSSPSFGENFSSGSVSNSNENKLINQIESRELVEIVIKCINVLKSNYRVVLTDLYVKDLTLDECAAHTNRSKNSVNRIRNRALLDFAFAMEGFGFQLVSYYKN